MAENIAVVASQKLGHLGNIMGKIMTQKSLDTSFLRGAGAWNDVAAVSTGIVFPNKYEWQRETATPAGNVDGRANIEPYSLGMSIGVHLGVAPHWLRNSFLN